MRLRSFVTTSLGSVNKWSLMSQFTGNSEEQWDHLELRLLVLLSLTFQIILLAVGSRRKRIRRYWTRSVIWFAYLSAETIATYALGVIQRRTLSTDGWVRITEVRFLWAPFLLMHLGGPDTITAYALEDNELWVRQFLELFSLAAATIYVLLPSWDVPYLFWLSVVVLICGLIKYGERVWVLWAASSEQFKDSTPEPQQTTPRMPEEQIMEEAEGHDAVTHQVIELHQVSGQDVRVDELSQTVLYERSQKEILIARELIDFCRPAFTDQPLGLDERDLGRSKFKDENYLSVFNIIAIELGFIYDLIFTKAMVFQTKWGITSRVVSLSFTTITIGVFTFFYRKETSEYEYDMADVGITFVLMVAAVFLDLYTILFHHLFSDEFTCWLIKHEHSRILSIVDGFQPLYKRRRWSNKIGQFNLLSYSLKEKHFLCRREILDFQKYFYVSDVNVSNVLKCRLYDHIKSISADMYTDLQSLWAEKWKNTVRNVELGRLKWSIKLEFDTCVLIWHIATEICFHDFHNSKSQDNDAREDGQVSLDLSRYMLHLLVMYPSMLPAGRGRIKYDDMHSMMTTLLGQNQSHSGTITPEEEEAMAENEQHQSEEESETPNHIYAENDSTQNLNVPDACKKLLNQASTLLERNSAVSSKDKSKFVMVRGCHLATQLKKINKRSRFRLLCETWIGMLTLGALKCDASNHLQQLRRGGELLTHVWLLLIHFGFTDHFQISDTTEIDELNVSLTVEDDSPDENDSEY